MIPKKEVVAMLLAGGQESHLGVITETIVKPAVTFGGKYRIIDFPLSNCINSGIDTVGVITEDKQIGLTSYIGIGIPWDLDRSAGGVTVLQTFNRSSDTYATTGPANAVYQNLDFIEMYDPEYVLIIPGDQVYKMDYEIMLDFHKALNAEVTIAAAPFAKGEKKYGVMTRRELASRHEIFLEEYAKKVRIEGACARDIAAEMVFPAVKAEYLETVQALAGSETAAAAAGATALRASAEELGEGLDGLRVGIRALEASLAGPDEAAILADNTLKNKSQVYNSKLRHLFETAYRIIAEKSDAEENGGKA